MKTLAPFLLFLLTPWSFAQEKTPAELLAEARAGAAALAGLGYAELAGEVEAALLHAVRLDSAPADRASGELAALEAAAAVMAESGALEVSGQITRQLEARTHVRDGNRARALEILVDGPDLGETLTFLDAAAGHCARTQDGRGAVIELGAESLRREWRRRTTARLADDVQRVIVAARALGVDHHADEIEAVESKPQRAPQMHRQVADASRVLAQLDPDEAEGWQAVAQRHQAHAYEVQQAQNREKIQRDLELLRLAEEAFERPGVLGSDRMRYEAAVAELEARGAPDGLYREPIPVDPMLVDLFHTAAKHYRTAGNLQLALTFDRATDTRSMIVRRDEEQRRVRKQQHVRRTQSNQAWHQELEQYGEKAFVQALRQSLRQASAAFERAGRAEARVASLGALRALVGKGLHEPGAPAAEELITHLCEGALYESGSRRAAQMLELAQRLELGQGEGSAPRKARKDRDELLERLEALEVEIDALRRELGGK